MIQRIQSLYLFVATALLVAVNFFSLVDFKVGEGFYTMTSLGVDASGVAEYEGAQWLCYLLPLLSLVAIYFTVSALLGYKNRIAQMRRCVYAMLSIIAYYVAFGVAMWTAYSVIGGEVIWQIAPQFPLIAIIFIILAGRAIKRDEDLVRAADRIR